LLFFSFVTDRRSSNSVLQNGLIHSRGLTNLIPMGRTLTQQEEKNDVHITVSLCLYRVTDIILVQADEDEDEDDDDSQAGPVAPLSVADVDEENDSTRDLDATMEDLDAEDGEDGDEGEDDISGDADDGDDMMEGDTEELDEGPSI
jgi:hypothetical protein